VGALDVALLARKVVPLPYVPIVTYHRVGSPSTNDDFDDGVLDASIEDFERQLTLLERSFTIITTDELRTYFNDGKPLPRNSALITFDDGYRACHDVALPILQRHGAKAVFFISTGHMNHRNVFWWDRISYLVKRSKKTSITIEYPKPVTYELSSAKERSRTIKKMLTVVKTTYALDLDRYLEVLGQALDVPWSTADDRRFTDDLLMTWDQVRALRKAGMDIQSHARTHRVLQMLTPEDLKNDLEGSRQDLEKELNEPVHAIAYPVGLSIKSEASICRAVRDAGYELGFSNSTGLGRLGKSSDPLDIQRVSVDPEMSHAYFRASVAVPHLTYRR
jgi:peptidoglycan/xylan/chitin deacetylase (PgdA/CDA1 family)